MQYAITLSDSIQAIPIIFSETGKYNPGKRNILTISDLIYSGDWEMMVNM